MGGFRTVYNEFDEVPISIGFYLAQILIYLIIPAIVIGSAYIFKDNRTSAILLSGLVSLGLNLIF